MDYNLSRHAMDVMYSRNIKRERVEEVYKNPSCKHTIAVNEIHYFAMIAENNHRCLKVVLNPISMVVITVYFDRNMRKRGCK